MAFLITLVLAGLVTPSHGGAAPVQGLLSGTPRAVPFESHSLRPPALSVTPAERQIVPPVYSGIPSNRRFNSVLPRAGGIGAPGVPDNLAVCPGSRRKTCNENGIHRVCLQLLENRNVIIYGFEPDESAKIGFKQLDYWSITGKQSYQYEWWSELTKNGGDSRCVGVDSTSILIEKVGCDKVNIRCDATDRAFVFMTEQPRTPGLKSLAAAKECVEKQCGPLLPAAALGEDDVQNGDSVIFLVGVMGACSAAVAFAVGALRRRRSLVQVESLLG